MAVEFGRVGVDHQMAFAEGVRDPFQSGPELIEYGPIHGGPAWVGDGPQFEGPL